jgi:hypothetical protein
MEAACGVGYISLSLSIAAYLMLLQLARKTLCLVSPESRNTSGPIAAPMSLHRSHNQSRVSASGTQHRCGPETSARQHGARVELLNNVTLKAGLDGYGEAWLASATTACSISPEERLQKRQERHHVFARPPPPQLAWHDGPRR